MKCVLGFDIGNTNTTMGIYPTGEISPVKTFRLRTQRDITSDELGLLVNSYINIFEKQMNKDVSIEGVAFSSVVPEVNNLYRIISKTLYNLSPLEINNNIKLGLKIRYDNPELLGVDRIVNAVAAFREHKRDCVIVDLGTATTFCVLLSNGIFDGGLIGPGIGITIEALMNKTSKLVKINFEKVETIVAKDTINAIKSGFFHGWIAMVEGIIDKIEKQYDRTFLPVITGGYSEIIGKNIKKKNIVDPLLTMKGIKSIYDLNYNK